MGYMTVEQHTTTLLHLKRSPGIRSWSLLVGIASIGLAAAYYSSGGLQVWKMNFTVLQPSQMNGAAAFYRTCTILDSLLWKLFYVTGCFFVAVQNMDEWEEAFFDKSKGHIVLKTFSLYARILTLWRKGQEKVVLPLRHLRDVSVEEEKVRYLGKGYLVVLRMATGFSHPLTHSATLGGRSDVEAIAALLKRFLSLEEQKRPEEDGLAEDEADDYSTDSEDQDSH